MTGTPLVLLAGPTGSGKTRAALHLAREFPAAVINFDSRQVYRDLPIVTAQPDGGEQAQCPHLLYGFLGCGEKITAGAFTGMAGRAVLEVAGKGRLPLLVGGTGLYMRSLLSGLAPIPPVPASLGRELELRCAAEGLAVLHGELCAADPAYAAKIHANDRQRILRALEVAIHTGHPLSWWHARPVDRPDYAALRIGLKVELGELTSCLAARITAMLDAGALDEVRAAWEKCPDPAAPGFSSIGCAELLAHLRGDMSLDEAADLWLRNTRAYAKRQLTWFAKEPSLRWVHAQDTDTLLDLTRAFVAEQGRGRRGGRACD